MINHSPVAPAAKCRMDTYLALRLRAPVMLGSVVVYSSIRSSLPTIFWSVVDMLR